MVKINYIFWRFLDMRHYFYKVPNDLIRQSKGAGIHEICVRYLLDEVRGVNDRAVISIKYIMDSCGWKPRNGADSINREIRTILENLFKDRLIVIMHFCEFPPYALKDAIGVVIDSDKFDVIDNYTMLTDNEFDVIIRDNTDDPDREGMLAMYLYIKSYCYDNNGSDHKIGFFQSYNTICSTLGFSREKISKLLKLLVVNDLLEKYTVKPKHNNDSERHFPNIYIPKLNRSKETLDKIYKNTLGVMHSNFV